MNTEALDRLKLIVESVLFVADEPVDVGALARIAEAPLEDVQAAVDALAADCRSRGVRLRFVLRRGRWWPGLFGRGGLRGGGQGRFALRRRRRWPGLLGRGGLSGCGQRRWLNGGRRWLRLRLRGLRDR